MNASKILVSAAVASTVVGAIAFAYAQTPPLDEPARTPDTVAQTQGQAMPPSQSAPSADQSQPGQRPIGPTGTESTPGASSSGAAADTPSDSGMKSTESPARTDRN